MDFSDDGNGALSWTNELTDAYYSVEWASSSNGPWRFSWDNLDYIPSGTNLSFTVSVPAHYRVVRLPEPELHPTIHYSPKIILSNDMEKTILTVSNGVPPYTWMVDDITRGFVDTLTGRSIIYRRLWKGDNMIRVEDARGDYGMIVVNQPY